jgi:hypothetical protein
MHVLLTGSGQVLDSIHSDEVASACRHCVQNPGTRVVCDLAGKDPQK